MPNTTSYLKTKDVLNATGITHQILYRYVAMGLVEEDGKRESGHRVFAPQTITVIKLIQRLNESGYTLRDIKEIFFKDARMKRLQQSWASPGLTLPRGEPATTGTRKAGTGRRRRSKKKKKNGPI